MSWHVGIDTGGTFTDLIAHNRRDGRWVARKIWSRHDDPAGLLAEAFESLGLTPDQVDVVVFGMTLATNALVENKLATVALLTTRGFKDVLRIARQNRHVIYSMRALPRPAPPVADALCFEVDERCLADGSVQRPLPIEEVETIAASLPEGCAAAVAFLHAYANPENERAAGQVLSARVEHVSLSSEVSPEAREYERTAATVLNAALMPLVRRFLSEMSRVYDERRFFLFQSAGGVLPIEAAAAFPLSLALSGPAAGVEAASIVARALAEPRMISLDMGGTTTDCCLIQDGQAELVTQARFGQFDVRQPMYAVESVGAGGGSIVRMSAGGITVGPESAGAVPGPACYGRGGSEPTLADAAAVLGYFGDADDLGRPITLDRDRALRAFEPLCRQLHLPPEDVALGVVRVANAIMGRAIKKITMDKGVDARTCNILAFGGAGPIFAGMLAQSLGIATTVVPAGSSSLSALGCLVALPSLTRQRTVRIKQGPGCEADIVRAIEDLTAMTGSLLLGPRWSDERDSVRFGSVALMRYAGQSYEIEIAVEQPCTVETLSRAFRDRHQQLYGFVSDEPWICEAIRQTATLEQEPIAAWQDVNVATQSRGLVSETRCCFEPHGWCATRQVDRAAIAPGDTIEGPALVLDELSTIVVPPGATARQADRGALLITLPVT